MASKKLPEYVHCAKCGYRGVDAKHDCTAVRAATAAVVDQAARRKLDPGPPPPGYVEDVNPSAAYFDALAHSADAPPPMSPSTRLLQLAFDHSKLLGRHVTYDEILVQRGKTQPVTTLEIQQRCRACCSDVVKRVHIEDITAPLAGIGLIGHTRRSYLQHRCPEARANLQGFTYAEIEELHAELDRELTRIGAYLADVDVIRKEQERATTSRKDDPR